MLNIFYEVISTDNIILIVYAIDAKGVASNYATSKNRYYQRFCI